MDTLLVSSIYFLTSALIGIIIITLCHRQKYAINIASLITVIVVICTAVITKQFIVPLYLSERYESNLIAGDSTYLYIARKFPTEYKEYISIMKNIIRKSNSTNEQFYEEYTFLNAIYTKCLVFAENDKIYAFYKAKQDLYTALVEFDPEMVFYLELPNKLSDRPDKTLISELIDHKYIENYTKTKETLIISAITNPQSPMTDQQRQNATVMLANLMQELSEQNQLSIFEQSANDGNNPELDKKQAVIAMLTFYNDLLATGVENTGIISRYIASRSQH